MDSLDTHQDNTFHITPTTADRAHATTAKDVVDAVAGGYRAHATTAGNKAAAVATGDWSHATTAGDDSHAANCRLIAAAPDMLNALRSLLRHAERVNEVLAQECGVRFVDEGPLMMARNALERAVGDA